MPRYKYRHYPKVQAKEDLRKGLNRKYRVVTINWTFATVRGKQDDSQVHRNEYIWTLRYLQRWIVESRDPASGWAEDIISIEPLEETQVKTNGSKNI